MSSKEKKNKAIAATLMSLSQKSHDPSINLMKPKLNSKKKITK